MKLTHITIQVLDNGYTLEGTEGGSPLAYASQHCKMVFGSADELLKFATQNLVTPEDWKAQRERDQEELYRRVASEKAACGQAQGVMGAALGPNPYR